MRSGDLALACLAVMLSSCMTFNAGMIADDRRQLFLPVGVDYFCRLMVSPSMLQIGG